MKANGKLQVWLDTESDFLEFSASNRKGFFRDLGNDVFERVDSKGNVIGIAIFNLKKRGQKTEKILIPIQVQFNRLKKLAR
ncbi:MAG: hypothetical protein Q7S92_05680 [Candidatus Diapherotrites archaeon]|nr:hypothetical protein [Candidatus Diapherotrites archaeon]